MDKVNILEIKIIFLLFFVSIINANALFADKNSYDAEFETIINGAELGDKILTSGKGEMIYKWTYIDSLSGRRINRIRRSHKNISNDTTEKERHLLNYKESEVSFAFIGSKIHCDEHSISTFSSGKRMESYIKRAFNGEKMTTISNDSDSFGLFTAQGVVGSKNNIFTYRIDPRDRGMKIEGTPVARFLRGEFRKIFVVKDISIVG